MQDLGRNWRRARRKVGEWLFASSTWIVFLSGAACLVPLRNFAEPAKSRAGKVDFNRDIRPILSDNCYRCHGPDETSRKAGLRFDSRSEALKPARSGLLAIVPGSPEKSELITRITAHDLDERMPPEKTGKTLTEDQIDLLKRWVAEGAQFAQHWAYVKPERPAVPRVKNQRWVQAALDAFILARLEREGMTPSVQANRHTLIRRVSLDLTGLPPTAEEVRRFVSDPGPDAYEHLVDRLLAKDSFGEHWARMWLDLARYADSAGYADDPPRTIWGYRDYVIRSFNANKPFNRFTIEQLAGDLLPNATEEDRVATAFHRNTMTNNEGGTDDEEFRNAAVVDRINTTMAVWMATSFGCAQCHNHKYDPISQLDYFRFFAIFNNTQDADRPDESPVMEYFSPQQELNRGHLQKEIARIEAEFQQVTPAGISNELRWERDFPRNVSWQSLVVQAGQAGRLLTNTFDFVMPGMQLNALRLTPRARPGQESQSQVSPEGFVVKNLAARLLPPASQPTKGRIVRVLLPGKERILSLAEVQVFQGGSNLALRGVATQSSTAYEGVARRAIDGNTDGNYDTAKSTTHTETSENPWWELDLGREEIIENIVIWNRTDNALQGRLGNSRVLLLNEKRECVWENFLQEAPNPRAELVLDGSIPIPFEVAYSPNKSGGSTPGVPQPGAGWTLGLGPSSLHELILLAAKPSTVVGGSTLRITLGTPGLGLSEQLPIEFQVGEDVRFAQYAAVPSEILANLAIAPEQRKPTQQAGVREYFHRHLDSHFQSQRLRLAELGKELASLKPSTVPIISELGTDKRRVTHVQLRGNFLALGEEVQAGLPTAFHPLTGVTTPTRLDVARWLVDENNPLTARVMVNRVWEQIFGLGIVRTCEDFGSQGDRPTHPELLDWLATEFMASGWNVKALIKTLVMSATYRQSSRITSELLERDPDNTLLARGPRFRMTAEEVRDQALAIGGLLSSKMYGPSVRPPRPSFGLSAAFGGSLDWKNSEGEDRYRRGVYVEWRRTSPYPSMSTFDAPNREVCALKRPRSNTPLQALVTLNDPVYVEAAQALGRRLAQAPGSIQDKITLGCELCLIRTPRKHEVEKLMHFYEETRADFIMSPEQAGALASPASHPSPPDLPVAELAAWSAIGNVLLNLDETLMKP